MLSVHSSTAVGCAWKSAGVMNGSRTKSPPRFTPLMRSVPQFQVSLSRGVQELGRAELSKGLDGLATPADSAYSQSCGARKEFGGKLWPSSDRHGG